MKKQYNNFVEVERMLQFLDIQEVTTKRQKKNGTREFKLPIKDLYCSKGSYIHVASFASGYVRRTKAGGYCPNWQINKRCEGEPEYFDSGKKDSMGRPLYTQFSTRGCVLIPNEQDRIAYLISFCLKNYYINRANIVARSSDKYVPKWLHEHEIKEANTYYGNNTGAMAKIEELEEQLLEKQPEVKVMVNGHRYNVSEWFK